MPVPHLYSPLGTCFWSVLKAGCCATWVFGLRCSCLTISYLCCKNSSCVSPSPPLFKSISRQNMRKAKQLLKSEFSGRHKCSCLIIRTCKLDRGSFAMMARSNAINQNKFKAILPILCLILIRNILCYFHLNPDYIYKNCSILLETAEIQVSLKKFSFSSVICLLLCPL